MSSPEDYSVLLQKYNNLSQEYEETKQQLHTVRAQMNVNENLLRDYQTDIEALQNVETARYKEQEAKIATLEETLFNLRNSHNEEVSVLEGENLKREQEIQTMREQLRLLEAELTSVKELNNLSKYNECSLGQHEIEVLQKYEDLQLKFEEIQDKNIELYRELQESQQETLELTQALEATKQLLSEKSELMEKLNDDIFILNKELESYRDKPLEENSKGNSLFAEVNDRRLYLQKVFSDLKQSYHDLQQNHGHYEKIITSLRQENFELQELCRKTIEGVDKEHCVEINSLEGKIRLLNDTIERQQQELERQPRPETNDYFANTQYYKAIIESKDEDIKRMNVRLTNLIINEHMMARTIARNNKELRLTQLKILELQRQLAEYKEREMLAIEAEVSTLSEQVEATFKTPELKSCLKSVKKTSLEMDGSFATNVIVGANPEEGDVSQATTRRTVNFVNGTVSPAGNSLVGGKRGTKVLVIK